MQPITNMNSTCYSQKQFVFWPTVVISANNDGHSWYGFVLSLRVHKFVPDLLL